MAYSNCNDTNTYQLGSFAEFLSAPALTVYHPDVCRFSLLQNVSHMPAMPVVVRSTSLHHVGKNSAFVAPSLIFN
ncbi:MAG: hypothetical protein ABGZ35_28580 [Planctomycetaceae bacterium]|jgi:hypothetical protein